MSFTWNSGLPQRVRLMVNGAFLRQQAELLTAISRTTFDLGVARRLREMALDLQARAAEHDAECNSTNSEGNFKLQMRS
jgi:hypothetical protein